MCRSRCIVERLTVKHYSFRFDPIWRSKLFSFLQLTIFLSFYMQCIENQAAHGERSVLTQISLLTLLYAGYSVKLKKKIWDLLTEEKSKKKNRFLFFPAYTSMCIRVDKSKPDTSFSTYHPIFHSYAKLCRVAKFNAQHYLGRVKKL